MPARRRIASRFQDIRIWDGSQDRAFEELCFQLRDPTPDGVELIKTSDPDAGVEWYWRHPDGTEEGWQVKFILNTESLLKAMRASLKSAAEKRPGLHRLTFCIAYDLADDPSRARGKQARERFDEAKVRWQAKWPRVNVDLLSGGQLLERLAREEHRGREWFFFGERILGSEWCARELEATIQDADDRYTPKQNVDLPIDRVLEAVALPAEVQAELVKRRDAVLSRARDLIKKSYAPTRWDDRLATIKEPLAELEQAQLCSREPPGLLLETARQLVGKTTLALEGLLEALQPIAWPAKPDRDSKGSLTEAERAAVAQQEREASSAQSLWSRARKVQDAVYELDAFLDGSICHAAERRALFVEGVAGTGKTHMFCDVGERLLKAGHPVVVQLGQRFLDASPWTTLARLLGDPGLSPDEIATALAASGEASGRRTVVFIDALNDAKDPAMWSTELADVRRRLTASGWVGLAVSCRTTYLDLVEPATGRDTAFARTEHLGYRGREFEATASIFAVHGVQQPRVPLLLPEFNNPLFLKLYCEGIRDAAAPPTGSEHLSAIFQRFIDGRKAQVERTLRLDRRLDVVAQALAAFAERVAEQGDDRVLYSDAALLINDFAPHLRESPRTLIETMASEGLLSIERGWIADSDELQEVVSFPYQRFSDHLVLRAFLDKHLPTESGEDVLAGFASDGPLGEWLVNAPGGLLEAFAIQLPERWGLELPDVICEPAEDDHRSRWLRHTARSAFVSSIVLRSRSAFGDRTHDLINDCLNASADEMANALMSVAPDPNHPYNGARLHAFLAGIPMARRDAYWTRLQYHAFGDPSQALDRLIRWAARGPYPEYPAEVIELACVPLVWHLASPNRFGRDYTTKALATVLIDRPGVSVKLIEAFRHVDDPYVLQRLAAAIAGAVTRGRRALVRTEAIDLVEALVATLIENNSKWPDVLTRDHVASLARWLRRRGLIPPRLVARASPPYTSKPPKTPRTTAYLETTYPTSETRGEGYSSLRYSALSMHSDWSRYVVSGRVDDFLPVKLGEPIPPPPERRADEPRINQRAWARFVASLSGDQRSFVESDKRADIGRLLDSLDQEQRSLLNKTMSRPTRKPKPRPMAYPLERACRFVFQRCIELGWSPERFGSFDSSMGRYGRESHKAERFGKKYQWIAFFELMARLADNFTFHDWGTVRPYEGAWHLGVRDIDPTLPPERLEVTDNQEYSHTPTFPQDRRPAWWSPDEPSFDEIVEGDEGSWAELAADLPTPGHLLRVTDADGVRWLVVEGYHNWRDDPDDAPSVVGEAGPDRDLAILTSGAVIRRKDLDALRNWLAESPDLLRSLPDWGWNGIYRAFWSELPAEAESYDYPSGWRRRAGEGRLPVSSAAVSLGYSAEDNGRDCSLTASVFAEIPSEFLSRLQGLEWSEMHMAWIDQDGVPRARYHETDEGFHRDRVLMLDEEGLTRCLENHDLAMAIGLFCERRVFDSHRGSMPEALGWVDYVGHLLFDGREWDEVALRSFERHAGSSEKAEKSSV